MTTFEKLVLRLLWAILYVSIAGRWHYQGCARLHRDLVALDTEDTNRFTYPALPDERT